MLHIQQSKIVFLQMRMFGCSSHWKAKNLFLKIWLFLVPRSIRNKHFPLTFLNMKLITKVNQDNYKWGKCSIQKSEVGTTRFLVCLFLVLHYSFSRSGVPNLSECRLRIRKLEFTYTKGQTYLDDINIYRGIVSVKAVLSAIKFLSRSGLYFSKGWNYKLKV